MLLAKWIYPNDNMCLILDIFNSSLPKYIMKVDDDTFVNLPLLWDQLQYASGTKNLLMGHRFDSSKRVKVRKLFACEI